MTSMRPGQRRRLQNGGLFGGGDRAIRDADVTALSTFFVEQGYPPAQADSMARGAVRYYLEGGKTWDDVNNWVESTYGPPPQVTQDIRAHGGTQVGSQPEPGSAPQQVGRAPLWGEGTDILGSAQNVGAHVGTKGAGAITGTQVARDAWGRPAGHPLFGTDPRRVSGDASGTADGQARADRLGDQAAQNAADFSNYLLGDPSYTSAGIYGSGQTPDYFNQFYRSGRFVGPEEAAAFAQAMEAELGYNSAADIRQSRYDVVNQKAQQALAQMSGNLSARGIQGGIAGQQAVGYARDAMIPAYAMIEQDYAQNLQRDYERSLSLAMNYQQNKTGYNVSESDAQYRYNYLDPMNRKLAEIYGADAAVASIIAGSNARQSAEQAAWLGFGGNILGAAGSVAGGLV